MHKIVLSGAQGTGKSTLLTAIETSFKNDWILIKEVVRSLVREQGIQINQVGDHHSQMAILTQHYRNCLQYEKFVTDRGSIDAFAYATYNYLNGKFTLEEHLEHKKIFELSLPYYTKFFYLPIEFELKEDGVRDTDVNYQKEIHKLYVNIYKAYNLQPIILTGSVENRLKIFTNKFCE